MRRFGFLAFSLAVLRLHGAGAEEEAAPAPAEELDSEVELDDLDLDEDANGPQAGMPRQPMGEPVEDFDLGLPEEDRRKRMTACFSYTLGRVQARKEMIEQTVQDMVQQNNMKHDQAMNALLFTWM